MSIDDELRYYLSNRIAVLLNEIDKAHLEITRINKLMRDAHTCDIQTVPPTIAPPPVPPLAPTRPKLSPSKSTPDIRAWPATPTGVHPALRPSVDSQSRYPMFIRKQHIS